MNSKIKMTVIALGVFLVLYAIVFFILKVWGGMP